MTVNFRPAGSNGKMYSPDRDMAYLYPALLKEVFSHLDEVNWTPEFKAYCRLMHITEDDLGEAVGAFMESLRHFIRNIEVREIQQAFAAGGFDKIRPECRMAIYAKIGESMTAGFFVCGKQVTLQGDISAMHGEYVDAIATARRAYLGLTKAPADRWPPTDLKLVEEVNELKRIIEQQNSRIAAMADELATLQTTQTKQD